MPRGEHFKKENPRINQVSFKVSDDELVALKDLAKINNVSVAIWLRNQILGNATAQVETPKVSVPKLEIVKEVIAPIAPIVEKKEEIPVVKQAVIEKAKNYEKPEAKNEQMSLF